MLLSGLKENYVGEEEGSKVFSFCSEGSLYLCIGWVEDVVAFDKCWGGNGQLWRAHGIVSFSMEYQKFVVKWGAFTNGWDAVTHAIDDLDHAGFGKEHHGSKWCSSNV